jgi:hypothetical protein
MVAAYRMKAQGWTLERALAEMREFGFDPAEGPKYQADIEEFSKSGL